MSVRTPFTRTVRRALGLGPPRGGVVLAYHRVAALAVDPQCLAVSPEYFAGQLEVIAAHGVPMTLADLLQGAREHTLPPGAVAVTFDDGYADNLEAAAPLLARAGVPATVFVSTGAVRHAREFWWDEVERLVLRADHGRHAEWNVLAAEYPTPHHRAYIDLCQRLRCLEPAARERELDELAVVAGQTREPRATHRPLSVDQVAALNRAGITVGSHTESHPSLASLSPEVQRTEIVQAQEFLESIVGVPVTSFAYPFGGSHDVSRQTMTIARDAGVVVACSTMPGVVDAGTNPLAVPRVLIRNWTPAEFKTRWSDWTGSFAGAAP